MNILEAMHSGRPFRAVGKDFWLKVDATGGSFEYADQSTGPILLSPADMLLDYEILELTATITTAQYWEAYEAAVAESQRTGESVGRILAVKLGVDV